MKFDFSHGRFKLKKRNLEKVINMERKIQRTLIKMVASKSSKSFVFILKLIVGDKGVG
jgi:hypothetical protein